MKDKLQQLRELLTPRQNWTQGTVARNKEGTPTGTGAHPDSVCWCLLGGIDLVCPEGPHTRNPMQKAIHKAIQRRYQNGGFVFIHDFNDDPDTTHEMVLEIIDRAVAAA